MTHYFASDVHLRLDHPERSERFAVFVSDLQAADTLVIAGDLCDFWFAARQVRSGRPPCHAFRALREFRQRGGELIILVGNHDRWLGQYYETMLAARLVFEPFVLSAGGFRIHVVHGHQLSGRFHWKRLLDTRMFLQLFGCLPLFVAKQLQWALMSEKSRRQPRRNKLLMGQFRDYLADRSGDADIFVFGHVHSRVDKQLADARLVVLGDWSSTAQYLAVDDQAARSVGQVPVASSLA